MSWCGCLLLVPALVSLAVERIELKFSSSNAAKGFEQNSLQLIYRFVVVVVVVVAGFRSNLNLTISNTCDSCEDGYWRWRLFVKLDAALQSQSSGTNANEIPVEWTKEGSSAISDRSQCLSILETQQGLGNLRIDRAFVSKVSDLFRVGLPRKDKD
jgi:hypothetical protein